MGLRIRRIREQRGLQMNELAEMVGVSDPYLSQIERAANGKKPSSDLLQRIADALRVPVGDLFDAPGGMAEPALEPLARSDDEDAPESHFLKAFPQCDAYRARDGAAAFGVLRGDVLAVDIRQPFDDGDLAVITASDPETGAGVTRLAIAHRFGNQVALTVATSGGGVATIPLDQHTATLGVVRGLWRDFAHSKQTG